MIRNKTQIFTCNKKKVSTCLVYTINIMLTYQLQDERKTGYYSYI